MVGIIDSVHPGKISAREKKISVDFQDFSKLLYFAEISKKYFGQKLIYVYIYI